MRGVKGVWPFFFLLLLFKVILERSCRVRTVLADFFCLITEAVIGPSTLTDLLPF